MIACRNHRRLPYQSCKLGKVAGETDAKPYEPYDSGVPASVFAGSQDALFHPSLMEKSQIGIAFNGQYLYNKMENAILNESKRRTVL